MLELKIIQEENARERMQSKHKALEKARGMVAEKKEQELNVKAMKDLSHLKKIETARAVK